MPVIGNLVRPKGGRMDIISGKTVPYSFSGGWVANFPETNTHILSSPFRVFPSFPLPSLFYACHPG